MDKEKHVDESWKEQASKEKEKLDNFEDKKADESVISAPDQNEGSGESVSTEEQVLSEAKAPQGEETPSIEIDFINYVTSLGFQAMIFLGLIANPITQEQDKNLNQAKFLIDTLSMIKDKTKGNLTEQEENLITSTVYELQLNYVDILKKEQEEKNG